MAPLLPPSPRRGWSGRCGRRGGRDNLPAHAPPGVLQLANDAVDQLRGFFLRLEDRVDGPGELVLAYVKHDHLAPDSRPISPATLAALRCAPIRPPQEGSCRTWHPPFSIHSGVRIAPFEGAEGPPDREPSAPRCAGNRRSLGGVRRSSISQAPSRLPRDRRTQDLIEAAWPRCRRPWDELRTAAQSCRPRRPNRRVGQNGL